MCRDGVQSWTPSRSERAFHLMRSPASGVVGAVREGFLEASLFCLLLVLFRSPVLKLNLKLLKAVNRL